MKGPTIVPFCPSFDPIAFRDACVEDRSFQTPQSPKDLFVARKVMVETVRVSGIPMGELHLRCSFH